MEHVPELKEFTALRETGMKWLVSTPHGEGVTERLLAAAAAEAGEVHPI